MEILKDFVEREEKIPMRSFKIESIEYGWFECRIGKDYVEASDYLGYDISKELLVKLLKSVKGLFQGMGLHNE